MYLCIKRKSQINVYYIHTCMYVNTLFYVLTNYQLQYSYIS